MRLSVAGGRLSNQQLTGHRQLATEFLYTSIEKTYSTVAGMCVLLGYEITQHSHIKENTMALEITDANFEEVVMKSDKPVLVDFWAEWCGPCRMVGPIVEEISNEYQGRAVVGKVDVDSNPNISMQFGIRNIPTLLIFKGGKMVDKQVGAAPKQTLTQKLDAHL